jgi:hypothetical protein
MSYRLLPIAVDLDALRLAIRSRDAALVGKIRGRFYADTKKINQLLKQAFDADDEPLSIDDVLRHLIMDEPYRAEAGFAYGYGLELLSRQIGKTLPNGGWSAVRGDWFDTVAAGLRGCGVYSSAFSIRDLAFRGPPVPLPPIDEFPAIGYLTEAEIGTARAALGAADFSRLEDEEVVAAIRQVNSWFDACAEASRDLVCFYA